MKRVLVAAAVVVLGATSAVAEVPASGVASFDALDANHSGALEGEEAKAIETVGQTAPAADVNDDGRIDRTEFEAETAGTTGTEVGAPAPEEEEAE